MARKYFVLLLFTFVTIGYLPAQNHEQQLPIKVLLLDESIAGPGFYFSDYPFQPALLLGTELSLNSNRTSEWYLAGNLGFYFHRHLRTAGFLQTQIGYRRRFGKLGVSLAVGPGVSLAFATQPVYVFEEGTYREGKNNGDVVFMPAANFDLSYRLGQTERSPELLLHYSLAVDAPLSVLPIPHLLVGGGLRFYPFK